MIAARKLLDPGPLSIQLYLLLPSDIDFQDWLSLRLFKTIMQISYRYVHQAALSLLLIFSLIIGSS